MKSTLSKHAGRRALVGLVAAAGLLLPTPLAGNAQAAEGDAQGNLTVRILDAAGRPADGIVALVKAGEGLPTEVSQAPTSPAGVYQFTDLPVGRYGVLTMTPWGGFACAGITPCDYGAFSGVSSATTTGVVDVTDVEAPTSYTLRTPAPGTVSGKNVVGNVLSITWSPGVTNFLAVSGPAGTPSVQWLRNGTPIPGAVAATYTTTAADTGRAVSARLSYVAGIWSSLGAVPAPYTLAGRTITKAASRTTVDVFRKKVVQGRSPGIRIDVTAANLPAAGQVKVKVGKRTYTRTLRNGSARVPVPRKLKPGRYQVVATYLGTSTYSPSRGTGSFKVVRKR